MRRLFVVLAASFAIAAHAGADTVAESLRDLLESEPWPSLKIAGEHIHAAGEIAEVYRARDYAPVWLAGPDRMTQLFALLRDAERHGLRRSDYHYDVLAARATGPRRPDASAELEMLASDAFVTYALHLGRGKVREERIAGWHVERPDPDLRARLERAANGNPSDAVADLLPRHSGYDRLQSALERYRAIARSGGWPRVDDGPSLRLGDTGPRVAALRNRLAATGDLPSSGGDAFDEALDAALRRFQARHGLDADGIAGPATRAALNVGAARRVDQIELNLERWRWLEPTLGDRYVMVNIAGFEAGLYDGDRLTLGMRAIVGTRYRRSPIFSDEIRYIVFSPYWNIPASIAHNEIRPQGESYMRRNDIEVLRSGRLRQRPGPDNALGRVKFMFPNRFNVYLHDTPARELFAQSARSFSHGCIRLEKPLALAEALLRGQGWTMDEIEAATGRSTPRTVNLEKPVPVHILYWTVWVDESGTVQFRRDLYGRDAAVLQALRQTNE
ncbi:MAG: L,D-transpeptidase family protein [Thermoanaerobaculia bacterium]